MRTKQQLCDIRDRIDILEQGTVSPDLTDLQAQTNSLHTKIDTQDDRLKRLVIAVAEGIEQIERKERRIDATVARARKQLADSGLESPGLESEAHELRIVDGTGSEERELPTVPEEVAVDDHTPSSIAGVSVEQLRIARGM